MSYRDRDGNKNENIIADNPFQRAPFWELPEVGMEAAVVWEMVFDFLEWKTALSESSLPLVGEVPYKSLREAIEDKGGYSQTFAFTFEEKQRIADNQALDLSRFITATDVNELYDILAEEYEDQIGADDELSLEDFATEFLAEGADGVTFRSEFGVDEEVLDDLTSTVHKRILTPRAAFLEWKSTLGNRVEIPQPEIESWEYKDFEYMWLANVREFGEKDSNRFASDYADDPQTGLIVEVMARGRMPDTQKMDAEARMYGVLAQAGLSQSHLDNMTPEQEDALDQAEKDLDEKIKRQQSMWTGQGNVGAIPDKVRDEIINSVAQELVGNWANPKKVAPTGEQVKDMVNNAAMRNFGIVVGDLSGPAASDEQYMARLAYRRVLDQIDALAAQGVDRADMNIHTMAETVFQGLPAPEEIDRRQRLRFGPTPPGTVVVGETPQEPQPESAAPQTTADRTKAIEDRANQIMAEPGDPITKQEAIAQAQTELTPSFVQAEADAVQDTQPQITAESENARRYELLQTILALDDGEEKQQMLKEFIDDEGLSKSLYQETPRVDAEGNPVVDADGNPIIDLAPINEAAVIMASFQPMPFQAIIAQREQQVGRSREDVMATIAAWREAEQVLSDTARAKGINMDEYTAGTAQADADIDAAQASVKEAEKAGRLAEKQLAQRDKEEQIRKEGFPVDVAVLPSSQELRVEGMARAGKAGIDAQEEERRRQAQELEAQRMAQANAGPRTLGGRLGA